MPDKQMYIILKARTTRELEDIVNLTWSPGSLEPYGGLVPIIEDGQNYVAQVMVETGLRMPLSVLSGQVEFSRS